MAFVVPTTATFLSGLTALVTTSYLVNIVSINMKHAFADKSKVLVPEGRERLEVADTTRLLVHLDCAEIQLPQANTFYFSRLVAHWPAPIDTVTLLAYTVVT